ncbi:hypothetical protein VIGAN_09111600, partial [Vigna angularis var. angularis]
AHGKAILEKHSLNTYFGIKSGSHQFIWKFTSTHGSSSNMLNFINGFVMKGNGVTAPHKRNCIHFGFNVQNCLRCSSTPHNLKVHGLLGLAAASSELEEASSPAPSLFLDASSWFGKKGAPEVETHPATTV